MNYSPADILRQAIVNSGNASLASLSSDNEWPIFVGHMPDSPNDVLCVYDTSGNRNGRIMSTGENIDKPGFQLRVRADDYAEAYSKINEITTYLSTIKMNVVAISGTSYKIHSVTKIGTILSLGQETDSHRRCEFTMNGTLTLTAL